MLSLILSALAAVRLGGCGIDKMVCDDDLQKGRFKYVEYDFRPGAVKFANCMQRSVESTEQERRRCYSEHGREARGDREEC